MGQLNNSLNFQLPVAQHHSASLSSFLLSFLMCLCLDRGQGRKGVDTDLFTLIKTLMERCVSAVLVCATDCPTALDNQVILTLELGLKVLWQHVHHRGVLRCQLVKIFQQCV